LTENFEARIFFVIVLELCVAKSKHAWVDFRDRCYEKSKKSRTSARTCKTLASNKSRKTKFAQKRHKTQQ